MPSLNKPISSLKFETIKKRAKDALFRKLFDPSTNTHQERFIASIHVAQGMASGKIEEPTTIKEEVKKTIDFYEEEGNKIIDAWDVRCVAKLIELFPESIPDKLRNKDITCDMDDNGWKIYFK